jgi:hypothetical protein
LSTRRFEEQNAFLSGATRDDEDVLSIGPGKPAIPLGKVGGDRKRGAIRRLKTWGWLKKKRRKWRVDRTRAASAASVLLSTFSALLLYSPKANGG